LVPGRQCASSTANQLRGSSPSGTQPLFVAAL
jgi:hypothetical protein